VKGATALVSGYVFLASLAAPTVLFAAPDEKGRDAAGVAVGAGAIGGELPAEAPGATPQPAQAAAGPAKQAGQEVLMQNIEFVPREITVNVGDTITWRNEDSEPHNAIAKDESFRTETIGEGETVSATIDEPGAHKYFCSIHAGMTGIVRARGSGSGSDGGGGGKGSAGGGTTGGQPGSDLFLDESTKQPRAGAAASPGPAGSDSRLPATGADAGWFALAGAWLLAVGAAISAALPGAGRGGPRGTRPGLRSPD
jgi:LPXTG-motif cell wall-anchored protein